jgi:hypothetical protein
MVGRRVKPTSQDGVRNDLQQNAGSKFRKKLSNGLALISLSQRKSVSGRQPSSNASLAVSAPSTNNSSTAILAHVSLSLQSDATSVATSGDSPLPSQESARASEDLQTPRPLPRARTFSYIPRPVKPDTASSPMVKPGEANETSLDTAMTDSKAAPPSRIPTPSPPQSTRRVSSPRQYVPSKPPLQANTALNRQSFASVAQGSPSKATVRSKTTSNLVKSSTPQSASFMAPRRPELKRPFAFSTPQEPVLAENVPTSKRVAQRQSQVHERLTKRESLAVPSAAANRRSYGPGTRPAQNKQASFAQSVSAKRLSAHLMQTPVTAKRLSVMAPESSHKPPSPCHTEETPLTNGLDLVPASSSTPTLSTVDLLELPLAPPPKIRPETYNDVQRRTLGTPNGLGGVWRSSEVFAAANHQVRRLPRSSTFHHFGKRSEARPPVPPVPNQCKLPSFSNLISPVTQKDPSISSSNICNRLPMALGKYGSSSRSLLSDIASIQRSKESGSIKSMSTSVSATVSEVPEDADEASLTDQSKTLYRFQDEDVGRSIELNNIQLEPLSALTSDTTALPPIEARPDSRLSRKSISISRSHKPTGELISRRCWSISQRFYPNSANEGSFVQVKDYMPPLYWAGRFQSRFDQWRTEAMVAQLHPEVKPEGDGPLGQCSIEDEKRAMILIFMQLRDLCASTQAADSLHVSSSFPSDHMQNLVNKQQEFEYKYRRNHKLLDSKFDLPPSLRKPDDSTAKGPIGRAVRKLTPRKASFANLFKGKGWNRADETKTLDGPGHLRELQDITGPFNGRETEDADSYESTVQLHTR